MADSSRAPATSSTSGQVVLDDGLTIPEKIHAEWKDIDGQYVDLTAEYDARVGRYIAREVSVRAIREHEVTGESLRNIPVASMVRRAVTREVVPLLTASQGPLDQAEVLQPGPAVSTLRHVARVYRLALLVGDAPTARVAESLEVPRSTAGRWVTRARDRGYLTVTDPRATKTTE
ncbi:hypothetical protein [Micromonospora sp. CA-244673]|uniref:hypothetical protein n=1 Tax=Micromonospora sp. CA-244673 TaxID=3239958 RepID=UPI003D8E5629